MVSRLAILLFLQLSSLEKHSNFQSAVRDALGGAADVGEHAGVSTAGSLESAGLLFVSAVPDSSANSGSKR